MRLKSAGRQLAAVCGTGGGGVEESVGQNKAIMTSRAASSVPKTPKSVLLPLLAARAGGSHLLFGASALMQGGRVNGGEPFMGSTKPHPRPDNKPS